ncbi:MAG: hypothetical protein QG556_246 [Pseudomonadota bacterium]|nr:hypothetical protein [Pseudomonadota bacterium]
MLLYSQFLNLCSDEDKIHSDFHLNQWLQKLKNPMGLKRFGINEIYSRLWNGFQENIQNSCQQDWMQHLYNNPHQHAKFIELIDEQAQFFIKSILSIIELKTKKDPLDFIPFNFSEKQGGVSIQAFFYHKNERQAFQSPIHGAIGQDKNKINVCTTHIQNAMFFCQDKNHKHLVSNRFNRKEYHGEEAWMAENGYKLIDELKRKKDSLQLVSKKYIQIFDDFWVLNFYNPDRLEFVLSTAPCYDCRSLFKTLREKLNSLEIYIPIIIHALYPCQSGEESELSPIQILTFQGDLVLTKIFTKTSYNKIERNGQSPFIHADLNSTEMLFLKFYVLMNKYQKAIESGQHLDKIFNKLIEYISKRPLSKADIGSLTGCLKIHPKKFSCNAYLDCMNLLKNKKISKSADGFNKDEIDNLFNYLFNSVIDQAADDTNDLRHSQSYVRSHNI